MNEVTIPIAIEVMHWLNNMFFLSLRLVTLLVPSLLLAEAKPKPDRTSFLRCLVAGWLHWTTYVRKSTALVLAGIDIYSRYEYAFPAYSAFASLPRCGLGKCLGHHMAFHTIWFLTKKLILQQKRVVVFFCSQDLLVLFCLLSHRSIWLYRMVAWLSED